VRATAENSARDLVEVRHLGPQLLVLRLQIAQPPQQRSGVHGVARGPPLDLAAIEASTAL